MRIRIRHSAQNGNTSTQCITIIRRNRFIFTIDVSDHTSRIHVVEHALIQFELNCDGRDLGILNLEGLIHSNVPLVNDPWMSME